MSASTAKPKDQAGAGAEPQVAAPPVEVYAAGDLVDYDVTDAGGRVWTQCLVVAEGALDTDENIAVYPAPPAPARAMVPLASVRPHAS